MKKEIFVVFYKVKGEVRTKEIYSTLENCWKDANKVSKKWHDVKFKSHLEREKRIKKGE